MKLAAIDIGTNSIRLLISNFYNSNFYTLERTMKINRIGRNMETTGEISQASASGTLKTLLKYKSLMEKHNVEIYRAVGTSALREAGNSRWFTSYIQDNSGIKIETVSGREEAYLSFYGAAGGLKSITKLPESKSIKLENDYNKMNIIHGEQLKKILVLDIGGGSTEFILGNAKLDLEKVKSINIGSVTLTKKFIRGDKPDKMELDSLGAYIRTSIKDTISSIASNNDIMVIGVAGSITTLAAIDLKLEAYDSKKIHHHILTLKKVKSIYKMLCRLNLEERKNIPGLAPGRADIIIGGTAVLLEILKILDLDRILVSEQDILDGIIYSLAKF